MCQGAYGGCEESFGIFTAKSSIKTFIQTTLFLVFVVPGKNKFVTFENRTDVLSHFWLGITSIISS